MVVLLLPTFNRLFETDLQFNPIQNTLLLWVLVIIWGIVGLLSGLIPALFWSRSKLIQSLHGNLFPVNKKSVSRHSLIVIQFVIAIVLISGTFMIRKQIDFMLQKDPKFDDENVIAVQTDSWQYENLEEASRNLKRISEELEANPFVESVSFSGSIPGDYDENYNGFYPEGSSTAERMFLRKAYVGQNYFKTMGIDFLNGSGFDQAITAVKNSVVLNKKAMEELGFTEATGQILHEGSRTGNPYRIVGVIDNFSYQGVQREIQPLAHFFSEQENFADWDYLLVKAKAGASFQVIDLLKEKWQEGLPGFPLTHFFANEKLNEQYKEYIKVNTLIAWFSILAILLSCVGLFALSKFTMARRVKEIGIRKVNGAKVSEILALLNKDFLKWVIVAFVIAVPLAYYGFTKWLEGFAYKTTISWWIFALAGIAALVIAMATVSWQSFRAAIANPVDALRDE
ncbi:ABC transporter permease [Kriegella aquimaris]|uniref:MacB-like core domain-containing protein n=1 Tax=Kriegella aquimaris TaxID=192904 RepID=A0A1G9LJR0_9FLAO|nr:FtsX-like permease family protein [Kriegella aquimaris]SDL62199.1 MacB-like core domain-containing protein [Kriegella aquimaris]